MAKKNTKTIDSILVRGIRIYADTIYTVGSKRPKEGAPEIYKELGSEKASSPAGGVANLVGFPMINGLWDTGLYPNSPVFREMGYNSDEAEIKSEEFRKFILEPLTKAGLKKIVDDLQDYENQESDFFLKMMITLENGVQFNTGDPQSRLALYAAILSGELAPQGKPAKEERELGSLDESHYVYSSAQYTISSESINRSVTEKREYANNRARGIFFNLLESDKKSLISLLNYEGINASVEDNEYSLSQVISKYFESFQNVESFIETYERSKSDNTFKEELKIMDVLLNEKGLKYLEKDGKTYLLKGHNLGTSPKSVAKIIAHSPSLTTEFFNLIEL